MKLPIAALLPALAGCVLAQQIEVDPTILAESQQPLACATRQECDLYWQRAQAYVNQHSEFRIQIATDAVISTYGPTDARLSYNLTRVSNADGSAIINVSVNCVNDLYVCRPSPILDTRDLKRFVRGL